MGTDPDIPMDPAREAALAERGRALVAAAVAETQAPLALRERLEDERKRAAPARRRRHVGWIAGLGTGLAAILVVVLLLAPGGSPGAPPIVEAARTAAGPAEGPAPAVADNPRWLDEQVGGIPFPTWQNLDWEVTGVRTDEVDGQDVTTVQYRTAMGVPVAYSIVDGAPLEPLDEGTRSQQGRWDVTATTEGGRHIITWEQDGHTCIISAPDSVSVDKLLPLVG